jgi:hypothetical protein
MSKAKTNKVHKLAEVQRHHAQVEEAPQDRREGPGA